MQLIGDIPVCGDPIDQGALKQIQTSRATCEYAALMADHHYGYTVPVGGVIASQELVSPSAVGFDIGCGNKAARLDVPAVEVTANISSLMNDVAAQISFGLGRARSWSLDHELFSDPAWNEQPALQKGFSKKTHDRKPRTLIDLAREQLGTVGSGNHYVDIFLDEQDRVWVGVHFGSRGFGHNVATYFLDAAGADDAHTDGAPVQLHMRSDLGSQYITCMELAGRYAYAGRDAVVAKVAEILGANVIEEVHNHHNYAFRETHDGTDWWVCRKGATPAFPGQRGFVGGSMGDDAVIIEGVDTELARTLMRSTVHGAGRVMSRTKATGRSRWGKAKSEPGILRKDMDAWIRSRRVELRGADVDEAPQAYKRLAEVLPQQGDSIRVLHTLRPIGVAMAGDDVVDPYKD
jgi:tRNA-splicing ligase RtcB